MIVAFGEGIGQATNAWLVILPIAAFCLAAVYRPGVPKGRRITEFSVGNLFRAFLSDEASEHDGKRKP